jgi:dihydroxyacetone kinase
VVKRRERELTIDTGDNLHFGLARLMAHSAGNQNVELVVVGDDVSVPHSRGKMVGRRCLAGITLGVSLYPIPCFMSQEG